MAEISASPATYERYTELRDKAGMKDAAVCRAAQISKTTISAWKKARYTPKYSTISKIAAVLGVEPQMILEGDAR